MSAIGRASIFDTPFLLPEGFDPEGTEIVRCLDSDLGFFRPKNNSVKTFLLSRRDGVTILFHGTPDNLEAVEQLEPGRYNVLFVSPKLDSPSHVIRSAKFQNYLTAMVKAWTPKSNTAAKAASSPAATSTEIRPFKGRCGIAFKKDDRWYDQVTKGEPNGIIYYNKGQKIVVGYMEIGQALPDGMMETIRRDHPDLTLDRSVVPVSANFVASRCIIAEVFGKPENGHYIIQNVENQGVIFEFDGPYLRILGRWEVGRPIPPCMYANLKTMYQNIVFDSSCLPIGRPSTFDWEHAKSYYGSPSWAFVAVPHGLRKESMVFINGDLQDVIIAIKDAKIDVIGYKNKPTLPNEIFKRIYERYRHSFSKITYGTPIDIQIPAYRSIVGTKYCIITTGKFINLVFREKNGQKVAKGMGTEMAPIDGEIAADITLSYPSHEIIVPLKAIKKREV